MYGSMASHNPFYYPTSEYITPLPSFTGEMLESYLHRHNQPLLTDFCDPQVMCQIREEPPPLKPTRLRWTPELHDKFLVAVDHLGGPEKAKPKTILTLMGVQGLTLYQIKSHLQKHRLGLGLNSAATRSSKETYSTTEEGQGSSDTIPFDANAGLLIYDNNETDKNLGESEAISNMAEASETTGSHKEWFELIDWEEQESFVTEKASSMENDYLHSFDYATLHETVGFNMKHKCFFDDVESFCNVEGNQSFGGSIDE